MNFIPKIFPRSDQQQEADLERSLLRMEANIGSQLFGPIPAGRRRQFFCLDEHTWVWHEEWKDKSGKRHVVTTRYDIRENGVLKSQDGQTYQRLSREEARNLYMTTELYRQRVGAEYHRMLQAA